MERRTAIEELVQKSIADDYEDFEMITGEVRTWAQELALFPSDEKIWGSLMILINKGLAKAYRLTERGAVELSGVPDPKESREVYFYLTPLGLESLST